MQNAAVAGQLNRRLNMEVEEEEDFWSVTDQGREGLANNDDVYQCSNGFARINESCRERNGSPSNDNVGDATVRTFR